MPSITALQSELGRVGFTVAVLLVLVSLLVLLAILRRRGARRTAAVTAQVALGIVVAGVLSLTLVGRVPVGEAERLLLLDPVEGAWGWNSIAWRPVYDNIVLFVPVGALVTAVWWRRSPGSVAVACIVLSVAIEAFQYLVPTGRVANSADVLANTTGALLGIGLAVRCGVRDRSRSRDGHVEGYAIR